MIKAVLFDLDGTLLNRDESVIVFIDKQYDRLHKWLGHIPKSKYKTRFIELDNRGYNWKDKVYQQLVDEFSITGLTWQQLLEDYVSQFQYSCVPFTGLIDMLEELKRNNLILGIITNGKGQFQMDNIKALRIEKYFEIILISEWERMKKPQLQLFQKALDNLNVSPDESMFIGDHPEKDVKAAQQAGMTGVWKKDRQWTGVDADFIVDDLKEVPRVVANCTNLQEE